MATSDEYAASLIKMTLGELKAESDRILNTPQKEYDFELLAQAQAVHDEMRYRKTYEPQGYTRFQAGFLMAFSG